MSKMEKFIVAVVTAFVVATVGLGFLYNTPVGRALFNAHEYAVQKVDDTTRYQTKKKVEDTCRGMLASHEADRLTYEQYKTSDSEEKKSWAEQAKMRANRTAASYNEFVLKNGFVWEGNVPADIRTELPYLE